MRTAKIGPALRLVEVKTKPFIRRIFRIAEILNNLFTETEDRR